MLGSNIGRFIALVLRHKPEELGISLDKHGWANVQELIEGIQRKQYFDMEMLEEIVRSDNKQRYSFNEDKTLIRANQGHSVQVDVELEKKIPPEILYHGTATKYEASIDVQGLIPKSRLHVHLSKDIETATNVGKRHGKPVLYKVLAGRMQEAGYDFYQSVNGVWLTDKIPPEYLEKMTNSKYIDYKNAIQKYIQENVHKVLKKPVSFIRYPFIDPGSVYDGNVWDWDTFWSVYGLLPLSEEFDDEALRAQIIEHAKGNVYNFLDHQLEDGYIPMMIEVGKWPEPYLNMRHQENVRMNMHKPFLCQQICLISDYIQDYSWVADKVEALQRYFRRYREDYFNGNCGLYVWHDDIMIGMDNDPASFGRPKDSTANIFLNSFMVRELKCMAKILQTLEEKDAMYAAGKTEGRSPGMAAESYTASDFLEEAEKLVSCIQEEMYDKRDKFFYSVDVDICTRKYDWFHKGLGVFWKTLPIKIRVWSGFLPMWEGFATKEQAAELVKHYHDESTFHCDYGVTTLAKDEKMFDLSVTNNPSNWLGPIWLVANYLVFKGMLNYGYREEAEEICRNSLKLLGEDLNASGSLHEYYNPFTGEAIMNGGFINWNILVLNMVRELEDEGIRL